MLKQRVFSAIVLIPVVLGATYLGGLWFAALAALAGLLAGYEFYHIMRNGCHKPSYVAGLALIAVFLLDAYYPQYAIWRWGIAAVVMLSMVWQILRTDTKGFLTSWALMLAGAVYIGGLLGHMIALRNLPQGFGWLMLTFAVTWVCDTAAYFAGSWWGKHGFFVHISPHKTWEGAIAGCLAGVLITLIAGYWMGLLLWQSLVLSIALVLGITFGDLAESLLKRQIGAKDSGTLIPGHGGMLDRIDSLLFAGVIVYYFVVWVVR